MEQRAKREKKTRDTSGPRLPPSLGENQKHPPLFDLHDPDADARTIRMIRTIASAFVNDVSGPVYKTNTSIAMLRLNVQRMLKSNPEDTSLQSLLRQLDYAHTECKKALAAIDRQKTVVNTGKHEKTEFSLSEILTTSISDVLSLTNTDVEWSAWDGAWQVTMDKQLVQEVFDDLLLFLAEKTDGADRRMRVNVENVTLAEQNNLEVPGGRYVKTSISIKSKNGIGEIKHPHVDVFEAVEEGRDLELAATSSSLKRIGGRVSISPDSGGATVFVYLPASENDKHMDEIVLATIS